MQNFNFLDLYLMSDLIFIQENLKMSLIKYLVCKLYFHSPDCWVSDSTITCGINSSVVDNWHFTVKKTL
jgi:hypothetical protein